MEDSLEKVVAYILATLHMGAFSRHLDFKQRSDYKGAVGKFVILAVSTVIMATLCSSQVQVSSRNSNFWDPCLRRMSQ